MFNADTFTVSPLLILPKHRIDLSEQKTSAMAVVRPPPDAPSSALSTVEKVLLSQVVCKLGTMDWTAIADLLLSHPVVILQSANTSAKDHHGALNPNSCSSLFQDLLEQQGLLPPPSEDNVSRAAPPQYRPNARLLKELTHKLYTVQIKEIIEDYESLLLREKACTEEIEAIKSGSKDEEILAAIPTKLHKKTSSREVEEDEVEKALNSNSSVNVLEPSSVSKTAVEGERDSKGKSPLVRSGRKSGRGRSVVEAEEIIPSSDGEAEDRNVEATGIDDDEEMEEASGSEGVKSEVEVEHDEDRTPEQQRRNKRKASSTSAALPSWRSERATSETIEQSPIATDRRKKIVKMEDTPEDSMLSEKESKAAVSRFKKTILLLIERLNDEPNSHYFKSPVSKSVASAYGDAVMRPMCIRDVSRRVKEGVITNSGEVMRDVALIFANAVQFNGPDTEVGLHAQNVWGKFRDLMNVHLSTELDKGY